MKKHIVSLILSTAMAASPLTAVPAFAEQTAENNTVSGYISLSDGIKFAGDGVTPVIYVDDGDYDGVKIAAENMAEDIKRVTDITAEINPSAAPLAADLLSENSGEKPAIAEINPSGKSMTISGYQSLTAKGRGIIAVYDGNKLEEICLSENLADNTNGSLTFSSMPSFDGKNVKGFLWEDIDGLTVKPLADAFDYTQSDEPTMKPDDEYAEIIIGTYGVSDTITALADSGAIDVSDIKNKWEAFTIRKTPDNKIVIAGSDKRGTIYGIYDFCEKIGVSPWEWWADVTPVHADRLYINLPDGGYTEDQSSVKYRGIFLNDEFNFCNWSKSLSDDGETNMSPEAYKRVYELILRLKANMMWPAMHNYSNAFHSNPENARLADEYGVVIGSSHAEPLLRNNLGELYDYQVEWETAHPDKTLYKPEKDEDGHSVAWMWTDHDGKETTGDPVDNKEFLADYWRDSVKKFGSYENIYTLGMRGVHDGPFNTNMESWSGALQEIINTQYNILKDELCGGDAEKVKEIPKVFIPYKDVLQYYNNGSLTIPDDVTIMWTDDNYGYTRQNANEAERARAGKAGVYYHISYYGNPSSYLWISSTQPGLIREELGKAYDMGADRMWILNVGDLKPAEKEIEYYAELGRNIETTRNKDISEMYADNAKRDFNMNDTDAAEYASIMDKYYELANSNRPEFIRSGNFSLTAYGDEAERYIAEYENICERAETLYNKLAKDKRDAFFELALYPIRGAKNMAVNYIQTDRAVMYAEQNRGQAVNTCAAQAQEALDAIRDDIGYYNTTLANGKWNGMADINPSHFTNCDMPLKYDQLAKPSVEKLDYAELDVITESGDKSMTVSAYDSYDNYFDVVNRGYGSFEYEITSASEAITLDKTSGTVYGSDRIYVGVDKAKAAASSSVTVIVKQMLGESVVDTKDIIVNILNPDISDAGEKTYIETNGTVSVEAEHYSRLADNGEYRWQIEKDFGRSGDSLKVYPNLAADVNNTAEAIKANSACAEYDVYFTTPGTYTVNIYRMPTLNARGTCRVAVGLDDGSPVSIGGTNNSPTSTSDSKRG